MGGAVIRAQERHACLSSNQAGRTHSRSDCFNLSRMQASVRLQSVLFYLGRVNKKTKYTNTNQQCVLLSTAPKSKEFSSPSTRLRNERK